MDTAPVRELPAAEVRDFLGRNRFGRLAVVLADEPQIVPVNYAAQRSGDDEILYIRSAPGDKLFAAATQRRVAFEVDEIGETGAISVIVHGTARIVTDVAELELVDGLGLLPWVATYKPEVIAIDVDRMSGRQFVFGPEPDAADIEPS